MGRTAQPVSNFAGWFQGKGDSLPVTKRGRCQQAEMHYQGKSDSLWLFRGAFLEPADFKVHSVAATREAVFVAIALPPQLRSMSGRATFCRTRKLKAAVCSFLGRVRFASAFAVGGGVIMGTVAFGEMRGRCEATGKRHIYHTHIGLHQQVTRFLQP